MGGRVGVGEGGGGEGGIGEGVAVGSSVGLGATVGAAVGGAVSVGSWVGDDAGVQLPSSNEMVNRAVRKKRIQWGMFFLFVLIFILITTNLLV